MKHGNILVVAAALFCAVGAGNLIFASGPTMQEPTPQQRTRIVEAGFNLTFPGTVTVQTVNALGGPTTLSSKWYWDYNGALILKDYTTTKGNGESERSHAERHQRGLLAKLKVFPPANTPPPGARASVGSDDTETLPSTGVIGRH